MLREQTAAAKGDRRKRVTKTSVKGLAEAALNAGALERLASLKAWRAEVAHEHNLLAFVIFHDATLRAIAERAPQRSNRMKHAGSIAQKLIASSAYSRGLPAPTSRW